MDKTGRWKGRIDELISVQTASASDVLMKWVVDDGIQSRGDRNSLLSDKYSQIGIGISNSHKQFKACIVVVLASEFELHATASTMEGARNDKLIDDMPKDLQTMPDNAVSMKVIKRTVSEWGKRTEVYMISYQMKDGSNKQVKKEYVHADEGSNKQPTAIQSSVQESKPQAI